MAPYHRAPPCLWRSAGRSGASYPCLPLLALGIDLLLLCRMFSLLHSTPVAHFSLARPSASLADCRGQDRG